jgi:hypothetical protein
MTKTVEQLRTDVDGLGGDLSNERAARETSTQQQTTMMREESLGLKFELTKLHKNDIESVESVRALQPSPVCASRGPKSSLYRAERRAAEAQAARYTTTRITAAEEKHATLRLRLEEVDLSMHTALANTKAAVLVDMAAADGLLRDALTEESRARSERCGSRERERERERSWRAHTGGWKRPCLQTAHMSI